MLKYLFLLMGSLSMINAMAADFAILSSKFKNGENIPVQYSCQGQDISPPFRWAHAPAATQSFALICSDPDAPAGTWYHWAVFNIPKTTTHIDENHIPENSQLGENSWGRAKYNGPCPPPGKPHHYVFSLYALDAMLNLPQGVALTLLQDEIRKHLLEQTTITGLFQR